MSVCPLCEDLGDGLCDEHYERLLAPLRRERDQARTALRGLVEAVDQVQFSDLEDLDLIDKVLAAVSAARRALGEGA